MHRSGRAVTATFWDMDMPALAECETELGASTLLCTCMYELTIYPSAISGLHVCE